jgi:leucyl aminopeptidase (aminopeptidase T)
LPEKLVNQCAAIHEGDLVLITGGVRDAKLLEDIAVDCRKMGAFPLISLQSEQQDRRFYDEVPAEFDSQSPLFNILLANNVAAIIGVDYYENSNALAGISAQRLAAVSKASGPVGDTYIKRGTRRVYLGNDLYPTLNRAALFGLSKDQLSKIFWDGINVDYEVLQATADKVKTILAAGKEVIITNPNGTDLKLNIQSRPAFASDGVISADDTKKGGVDCTVYLPAGEVYVSPVPGTAEGKVIVDKQLYQGKEILGLVLTFKAGKLVSMTAKSGLEPFKALFDAADSGKDDFSYIDIGINPNVKLPPNSELDAWMAEGMVTVGMGNNLWAGGEDKSTFSSQHFLHASTLIIDGKKLVVAGVLKP